MTDREAISRLSKRENRKNRTYGHLSDQMLCELHMSLASRWFPDRLEKRNVKAEMEKRNITFVDCRMKGVFHKDNRDTAEGITEIEAGSVYH